MAKKVNVKKLKMHLVGGCDIAPDEPTVLKIEKNENGYEYVEQYPATEDLASVTCGFCKTKILNELFFKDWSQLDRAEYAVLYALKNMRNERKRKERN